MECSLRRAEHGVGVGCQGANRGMVLGVLLSLQQDKLQPLQSTSCDGDGECALDS